jgi:hypothetical protein
MNVQTGKESTIAFFRVCSVVAVCPAGAGMAMSFAHMSNNSYKQ